MKPIIGYGNADRGGTGGGGRGRTQKLTNQTAEAFVVSTRANIEAAELLLTQHNFIYVLPGVFADEALEKFFGQARQRSGGNFYIDIVDIKAAAKTKNLHALLKYESTPCESHDVPCTSNICIDDDQFDITIADTEDLVQSNDSVKHKCIFLAGYLEHKYPANILRIETENDDDHRINSEFLTNLNRGVYEYTPSRPIWEVKQRRARLVLGWVTAWEYRVLNLAGDQKQKTAQNAHSEDKNNNKSDITSAHSHNGSATNTGNEIQSIVQNRNMNKHSI
ncbi:unnamed protein product [Clavelina lepadiformis]|uniref:Uncharacterized protein n=1 Tax=Clavelina lepadiformis TaxID=159417 RepID=A0ABP0GGW5_CLALP